MGVFGGHVYRLLRIRVWCVCRRDTLHIYINDSVDVDCAWRTEQSQSSCRKSAWIGFWVGDMPSGSCDSFIWHPMGLVLWSTQSVTVDPDLLMCIFISRPRCLVWNSVHIILQSNRDWVPFFSDGSYIWFALNLFCWILNLFNISQIRFGFKY